MLQPPKVNKLNAFMIKQSGRSWWQVQYASGKVISEWETSTGISFLPTVGASKLSRWEEIPKVGMRGMFLLCPSGYAAALEANGEYSLFQLKVGTFSVGSGQTCLAHIIGKIDGDDGRCVCYAWEYDKKRGIRFEDNVTRMSYHNIGQLSLGHHTGIR